MNHEPSSDAAVAVARDLFWRNGYEDTSIEDVVSATGLNRYALYTSFGGKRELFLAALDDYYSERKRHFLSRLADAKTPPLDAVRSVFEFAISEMAERGAGCLMCNVASDVGRRDAVVAERIAKYLSEIRKAYTEALRHAASRGDLNPAMTPEAGASLLIAVKLGLGAHAENGATRREMLKILNAAMSALRNPKQIEQPNVKNAGRETSAA